MDIFKDAVEDSAAKLTKSFETILIEDVYKRQAFDKMNENFIHRSFFELLSRYLSNCYTFAIEQNLPSDRKSVV